VLSAVFITNMDLHCTLIIVLILLFTRTSGARGSVVG
jgi:hypothetical protein